MATAHHARAVCFLPVMQVLSHMAAASSGCCLCVHVSPRARMVVGADGVRSAVRASMFPEDPGPRFLVSLCCRLIYRY